VAIPVRKNHWPENSHAVDSKDAAHFPSRIKQSVCPINDLPVFFAHFIFALEPGRLSDAGQ